MKVPAAALLGLGLLLLSGCRGPRPAELPAEAQAHKPKEVAAELTGSDEPAPPRSIQDPACLRVSQGKQVGQLSSDDLDEVSGVVSSRATPGLLWVHNDSGDSPRVFALEPSGQVRTMITLRGADAVDFEDIAIGPGPSEGRTYLYVGDIGDNFARRDQVQIYWFEEPNLQRAQGKELAVAVHRLDISYEGGPRDAEALMMDPSSGDLYIVTKGALFSNAEPVPVFRIPREDLQKSQLTLKPVVNIAMGPVTAADVLPDGSGLAIRNYRQLHFWPRKPEQSLADALRGEPCAWPLADLRKQGESFGFRADGRGYYTIAEGEEQPIYFYGIEP